MLRHGPNTIQYRFFGPVYGAAPATDIFGSVMIAMPRISAVYAVECFTLSLAYVLAAATRFASVSRGCVDNFYALTLGFVSDVHSKLVKAPAIMESSLRLTKPFVRARTNAFKFFETNCFTFLFSLSNQCFGNGVINNLRSRSLTTGNAFQCFVSTTGSARLQRCSGFLAPPAKLIQGLPFVGFPIRIGSDVLNTQIYSKNILAQLFLCVRNLARSVQVEFALDVAKIAFALLVLQQFGVMFTRYVRNLLSGFSCPNRNDTLISLPRQYTGIVANRAIFTKLAYPLFVELVAVSNFAHAAYYRLRRKACRRFDVVVGAVMDFILTKRFVFPRPNRNTITGSISLLHSLQQYFSLFVGRLQAYFSGQFHNPNIHNVCQVLKYLSSKDEGVKPFRGL